MVLRLPQFYLSFILTLYGKGQTSLRISSGSHAGPSACQLALWGFFVLTVLKIIRNPIASPLLHVGPIAPDGCPHSCVLWNVWDTFHLVLWQMLPWVLGAASYWCDLFLCGDLENFKNDVTFVWKNQTCLERTLKCWYAKIISQK